MTKELRAATLEDVWLGDGEELVGRLATFSDGFTRAFWTPGMSRLRGSRILILNYCGAYPSREAARAAVVRRAELSRQVEGIK